MPNGGPCVLVLSRRADERFPAIANLDESSRTVSLTIFTESGTVIQRSVKHYSIPVTQRDKERHGLWAFNRHPDPVPVDKGNI